MTAHPTSARWRRITATAVGATAISVGAMSITAPVATAAPTEAQQECGSEDPRDVYTSSTNPRGELVEKCCYHSGLIIEIWTCTTWINGKVVSLEQPAEPTVKPGAIPPRAPDAGQSQPPPTPKLTPQPPVVVAPQR